MDRGSIFWIAMAAYLVVMNLIAFTLMGIDKHKAKKHKWRIPEKTLFLSAMLGGTPGALSGMYYFRHKTKHWYFQYGMPAILMVQLVIGFLIIFCL